MQRVRIFLRSQTGAMKRLLQFISWPAIAGLLLAVILIQYQQLQQLSRSQEALQQGFSQLQAQTQSVERDARHAEPRGSHAVAVASAAASVVSIHSTIREQIELPPADELPLVFRELLRDVPSERLWDSLGSGVAINDQGYILTALHVIEGAEDIEVHFGESISNTTIASATVIGTDPSTDLALLRIDSDDLPPAIRIGSSDQLRVGDTVLAIGYPRRELMNQKSVSHGIVSALGIPRDGLPVVDYIQTDAAMNYGNSGGALINARGELVGINSFIYSESGGSDGIGFAVPANKAMVVAEQLMEHGEVTPGYLGVVTGELLTRESSLSFFGRSDIEGLLVEQVSRNSPAEEAGIQPGDVMTAIDGNPITSVINAIEQINRKLPGQSVDITLYRDGDYEVITAILGAGTAQYRAHFSP